MRYNNFTPGTAFRMGTLFLMVAMAGSVFAQQDTVPDTRSILLEQLRTTHDVQDWFVPASLAIDGLTAEQANWKDETGNHSIAQLTTHLIFWNERLLKQFKGETVEEFGGDNTETFEVDNESWSALSARLDQVLSEWEEQVSAADEAKLGEWYSNIAHIGTHNAYHTGQILYIRKMKGWWDDNKGVK